MTTIVNDNNNNNEKERKKKNNDVDEQQILFRIELLIVNTGDLFKDTKIIYETLLNNCNHTNCSRATAGVGIEYILNKDLITSYNIEITNKNRKRQAQKATTEEEENHHNHHAKKSKNDNIYQTMLPVTATSCPAPVYFNAVFAWVKQSINSMEKQRTNPFSNFATNNYFFNSFLETLKKIYRRLFRVYAHMYLQHFQEIRALDAEAHLNSMFKRFVFFALSHDLLNRTETLPLDNLIKAFVRKEGTRQHSNLATTTIMI